jgi:cytochrome c biogenesis protein CcmG/thiol:disulfide interchange protein DsbE
MSAVHPANSRFDTGEQRVDEGMSDKQPKGGRPAGRQNRTWILVAAVVLLAAAAIGYAALGAQQPALKVGQPAPAFSATTREGLKIDSQQLKNNVVVVNFFASWCKPCQEEAAGLEAVWKEYRQRNVFFLGVTYQDTEAKVTEFLKTHGVSYLIANDDGTLSKKFGITGVPETYIISRDGNLAFKAIGPVAADELRAELNKTLR